MLSPFKRKRTDDFTGPAQMMQFLFFAVLLRAVIPYALGRFLQNSVVRGFSVSSHRTFLGARVVRASLSICHVFLQ